MKKFLLTSLLTSMTAVALAAPKPQLEAPSAGVSTMSGSTQQQIAQADMITGKGAYVGGGLGTGEGGGSNAKLGLAFGLDGGYLFTPSLGLEVGFTRLATRSNANNDGSSLIWDVAGVLTAPLQQRLRMFGKAGFAMVDNTVQVTNATSSKGMQFAALLGGGISYQYNPILDFNLQALATIGDGKQANSWGLLLGTTYHFTP